MQQTKITCDLCKKEVVVNGIYNTKFKTVTLEFGYGNKRQYYLCPDCLEKHGLVKETGESQPITEKSTAEKLYEIIAEIVAENLQR